MARLQPGAVWHEGEREPRRLRRALRLELYRLRRKLLGPAPPPACGMAFGPPFARSGLSVLLRKWAGAAVLGDLKWGFPCQRCRESFRSLLWKESASLVRRKGGRGV